MRSMQCQLGNLGTISAFALKTQGNQDLFNEIYAHPYIESDLQENSLDRRNKC
jgi:hypothetical protein